MTEQQFRRVETILHPASMHERTVSTSVEEIPTYVLDDLEEGKDSITCIVRDDTGVRNVTIRYPWHQDYTQTVTVTYVRQES